MTYHTSRTRNTHFLQLAALLFLAGAAGCFVDVGLQGSRLKCGDEQCPSGFECVDMRCVAGGSVASDASTAEPPEADAAPDIDSGQPADGAPAADGAPPPDAPPDAAVLLTCDQQYGPAPGYVLCNETEADCTFFVQTAELVSCDQNCAQFGGTCLGAQDDAKLCQVLNEVTCQNALGTKICRCSRSAPQ